VERGTGWCTKLVAMRPKLFAHFLIIKRQSADHVPDFAQRFFVIGLDALAHSTKIAGGRKDARMFTATTKKNRAHARLLTGYALLGGVLAPETAANHSLGDEDQRVNIPSIFLTHHSAQNGSYGED